MFGVCGMWPVGVFLATCSFVFKSIFILVRAVEGSRRSCCVSMPGTSITIFKTLQEVAKKTPHST